ncbi:MAG: thiamine pyrophosphate-dependent enzyme [Candidatus Binatia bacterium]
MHVSDEEALRMLTFPQFKEQIMYGGHSACPGCGSTVALRMVLDAVGPHTTMFVPASCASTYVGSVQSSTRVHAVHCVYPSAFGQAAGYVTARRMAGDDVQVLIWGGDGAFYDIGMDGLSHVAAQGFDIVAVCNDNQGYMNTGHHSSSSTVLGTGTKLTPAGMRTGHKEIMDIVVAHGVTYAATVSAAYPDDLKAKVVKATRLRGFKFLHLLASCVNWGYEVEIGVKLARLAVTTRIHPLYEVEGGAYRFTHLPPQVPVEDYLKLQARFRATDAAAFQKAIDARFAVLWEKAQGRVEPLVADPAGAHMLLPVNENSS